MKLIEEIRQITLKNQKSINAEKLEKEYNTIIINIKIAANQGKNSITANISEETKSKLLQENFCLRVIGGSKPTHISW